MSCELSYSALQCYFDGELSVVRAIEFKRHLAHCSHCMDELEALSSVRGLLQHAHLYEPAPASLQRKVRADLHSLAPATDRSRPIAWHWLAVAAGLLFVALILWRAIPGARMEEDYQAEFAAEIVDAHVRSLPPRQITTVNSSDPQTVRAWFEDKVKFAFPVRDFANNHFVLLGGRVDIVQGRMVAALVYRSREQFFNVFIWRTRESDSSPRAGSRQGYQWIDWRKGKLEFCTVSDAAAVEVGQLQQLLAEEWH